MLIQVTQEDINNGQRSNSLACPLTLAIRRALKNSHVSTGDIQVCIDCNCISIPRNVRKFIRDFDGNVTVYPFEFELDYVSNNWYDRLWNKILCCLGR